MQWEVVVGLETHAQLSTASKMFSGAPTAFGAAPNTQACAVDIALPGVLPVANKSAVERAICFGLAVGGTINRRSVFARKNYFYPDLPKGYQISQYELPIVQGGSIPIQIGRDRKDHPPNPRPSGRGRRQAAARAIPRPEWHRPQPGRQPTAGNRVGARDAQRRGGGRLCQDAPRAGALDRHQRRQHAGRVVPLRCQRLGAPEGQRQARYALRDQEPQLVSILGARHRIRGEAPDRDPGGRRKDHAGNPAV